MWYGMQINWQAGKTEAIIVYRGKGAKKAREQLFQPGGARMFIAQRTRRRLRNKTAGAPTLSVHVVSSYKHLGSIICESRSLVPEARQRERSALSSFVPIAQKVIGSKSLSLQRRVQVATTFVMSRLFYNVHVWSIFAGKARDILNAVYMRTWRRAVGDPRHGRTTWTNAQVLRMVGMPTIETFVRRRRLNYFSRLATVKFDALQTLLQQRDKYGKQLPWVQLILGDLRALRHCFTEKLGELPCPLVSMEPYWRLATDYPHEWKCLVKQLADVSIEVIPTAVHSGGANADGLNTYTCEQCSAAFCTYKKLTIHRWSKHRERCEVRRFIGNISQCPICYTDFVTRPRLVKHLLENRVRSVTRGISCRHAFIAGSPKVIPQDLFELLETRDAATAKADRRNGHTSVIANIPCRQTTQSILIGAKRKRAANAACRPRHRLRVKTKPADVQTASRNLVKRARLD